MKFKSRGKRGQFSIIAALLITIIMVSAVIMTYATIRNLPFPESPKVLSSLEEMNLSLKRLLEFTVGYYGSILQVTGNVSYAKGLTSRYLQSGLVYIAHSHPEWNPSFDINHSGFSTRWYEPTSYSMGNLSVAYSLSGLGLSQITYKTSALLKIEVLETVDGQSKVLVTREENKPDLTLSKENFFFYNYSDSTWKLINPDAEPSVFSNGTYVIQIPSGVEQSSYFIKVSDLKGIMATAFFSNSKQPKYTYTFTWNTTLYPTLTRDTIVVEAQQNGTLRWLGQNLQLSTQGKPIPPIPVKALRVNQTVNGIDREVPFQVEDWGSNYRVPLGLTSNASLFGDRQMVVFLANHNVQKVTLWWDGRDIATQTPYALENRYFNDDPDASPSYGVLNNGLLRLRIYNFRTESRVVGGTTTSTAEYMRINGEDPVYGADPAYVIYDGVVRDIVQQEAEWSGGISENLYVDGFDWTDDRWRESGSSPYLHNSGSSYIYDDDDLDTEGWFSFQDLSAIGGQLTNVRIQFECRCSGDEYFDFQIDNGTQVFGYYAIDPPDGYGWREYDLSDILNTVEEVNNARVRVRYRFNTGRAYNVYIRRCRLVIECPNVYSQIVLTLPANATYYTYAARTIFVDSNQNRTLTDLSAIQLSVSLGQQRTENGTSGGYPVSSSATGLFYNLSSPTGWAHHWSEFISGNSGAGIMFTDNANQNLYIFDGIAGEKTGALNVMSSGRIIEVNPVERYTASFTYSLDVTWHGAVVTFEDEPIYPSSGGNIGLWIIVEYPPTVAVD